MTPKCKHCGRNIEKTNEGWTHSFFDLAQCQLVSNQKFYAEPETVEV
jgi:hypothetical protein